MTWKTQGLSSGLTVKRAVAGLLSNKGEKSINFYFTMVPLRKKVLKYGTPKPRWVKGYAVCSFPVLKQ